MPPHKIKGRGRPIRDAAHMEIDQQIGARIRMRRNILGYDQPAVAEMLGYSNVAYRRLEVGQSSITASHLILLGQLLDVPASYFLHIGDPREEALSDENKAIDRSPESLAIIRALGRLSTEAKNRLMAFLETLADDLEASKPEPE